MYIKTLNVSDLNNYIKKIFDNDFILENVSIEGEISNFKYHSSGHAYFALKDENSKINCIMFSNHYSELSFVPYDGMKVVISGRVSVYQKEGSYQLYASEIKPFGEGELYIAYNKLKTKLERKGYFDNEHKKPLPHYPMKIGVVTSPTGAAIRDIINVAKRHNPNISLLIYPALVQGKNSASDMINGLERLDSREDIDLIILARGGGSIEELWSFNDEKLADAIYNCKKPVVTGVGHETDFTIVDFVSDMRAPTPSAAAEISVPCLSEIKEKIINVKNIINTQIDDKIYLNKNKLNSLSKTLEYNNPLTYISNQYTNIDNLKIVLNQKIANIINMKKEEAKGLVSLLNAHNPLNVLTRGYSIIEDSQGRNISKIEELKNNKSVKFILSDGFAESKIDVVKTEIRE